MTELVAVTAIIGLLSSVAIPNYQRSLCKTKQYEAVGEISMLKTAIMGYTDERGSKPETWDHINEIVPVLTVTSKKEKAQASGRLQMDNPQRMRSNNYDLTAEERSQQSTTIEINAATVNACENFGIKACINTQTGVTDIEKGNGSEPSRDVICS